MYVFVVWLAFIWFFILFCDTIFKTCMFHPYFRALQATGLDIKPLMIYWRTTRFNRVINRMGHWKPSFFKCWFNVGAFITCSIAFPCLLLYVGTLFQMFYSTNIAEYQSSVLLPLIPGLNLPVSDWMLYICIILICSVIHEFGHALAASRERISVENWGFALCIICPLAFVHLRLDQFRTISKWQQMRILCAGIWHNIILSLWALLSLLFFSVIFSPLFYIGSGVSVIQVHEQSGLNNPGGFVMGDHIYKVGNCSVKNSNTWLKCLDELKEKSQGLCVPESLISGDSYSENIQKCANSEGGLYFQTQELESANGICLRARTAVQEYSVCIQTPDCEKYSLCMFPHLLESHKFVVIQRYEKPAVLYEGSVDELKADVKVSEYLPRFKIFPSSIAEFARLFLEYVLMFSSGLACLNVLPIFALDGQYIIENLIHICLSNCLPRYEHRRYVFICISKSALGIVTCLALVTVRKFYLFYF